MSPPAIELRNITKDYQNTRALNDVQLIVDPGEIFGYVGANGAGKTTTLKILAGLIRPTFGDALVSGYSILSNPLEVKSRIGYVPESGAVFDKLSPREYLTTVGQLYRMTDLDTKRKVIEWLELFGLADRIDQRMEIFSKGMKQKVCWIAALLHDPEVLILDEPLSGLDVEAISKVKDLMKRLVSEGKTVFYSSHLIDVVEKICTRIAVLQRGRIIGAGRVAEVTASSGATSLEEALMKLWQEQV
ncbi:MAG TPA: ABC transporter ATP-binding protein [Blastocatellia bacterium]|nr:ABC transporter ATP-binding protein [Blastocatellia bacterium]